MRKYELTNETKTLTDGTAMRIHDILEGVAGSLDEMARMIRK